MLRTNLSLGCKIVAGLRLRLLYRFRHFLWLMGAYVHAGAAAEYMDGIKAILRSRRRCRIGMFCWRFMGAPVVAEGKDPERCRTCVRDISVHTPGANVASENRFARARVHNRQAVEAGQALDIGHVSAKHFLAESITWYELTQNKVFSDYRAKMEIALAERSRHPNDFRDGYRAYINENIASVTADGSFKSLAWRRLPPSETAKYEKQAEANRVSISTLDVVPLPSPTKAEIPNASPFGLGDASFVISEGHPDMQFAADNIAELKRAWPESNGTL